MMGWVNDPSNHPANSSLLAEVIRCKETGVMSDLLASYINQISWRVIEQKFGTYIESFKEEMISEAVVQLTRGWSQFDPTKSNNVYQFYWCIAYSAGLRWLNIEWKESTIRKNCD